MTGTRIAAWAVHGLTASGAVAGFLAAVAVERADFRAAFAWLFVAGLIDAADGWLARVARVKEVVPGFNGARLDDIVDYLTFVFVPALLAHRAELVPADWSVVAAAAMLLSSAYGFGREDAKTPDHFFTGFPSYWNIVVFYLYAAPVPPVAGGILILVLAGLVFVPIGYVYPSRTPVLRRLTVGLGVLWGAAILMLLVRLPERVPGLLLTTLLFPAYYAVLSFVLHRRRTPVERASS